MKIRKSASVLIDEAEKEGRSVAMNSNLVDRNRTELAKELETYFKQNYSDFNGCYDENEGEEILDVLNDYIDDYDIDMYSLDFPFAGGTVEHLIPITDNLQLKVLVADEYFGDGDYEKFVVIDRFIITEKATTKDVDKLIEVLKEYYIN